VSPDGYNFATNRSTSQVIQHGLSDIAWDGTNNYVMVGLNGDIWRSAGSRTNWIQSSPGTNSGQFDAITFFNGRFVAVGYQITATSIDRTNWTERHIASDELLNIATSGSECVAAGQSHIYTSTDGSTWTTHQTPDMSVNNKSLSAISWDGTKYDGGGYSDLFISELGMSWYDLAGGFYDIETPYAVDSAAGNNLYTGEPLICFLMYGNYVSQNAYGFVYWQTASTFTTGTFGVNGGKMFVPGDLLPTSVTCFNGSTFIVVSKPY
jgi:hypothetical protein